MWGLGSECLVLLSIVAQKISFSEVTGLLKYEKFEYEHAPQFRGWFKL